MDKNTTPLLSDDEMIDLGFVDVPTGFWYFTTRVADCVSLNIHIDPENGQWEEYVLNEDFCQPEYYMMMKPYWRDRIVAEVDKQIAMFRTAGLDIYVDHKEYGW